MSVNNRFDKFAAGKLHRRCTDILTRAGLRRTGPRIEVLSVLVKISRPMTQEQIAGKLKDGPDKVTIYRTLESLLECGIIHRAYVQERSWYYELADNCSEKQCHPHFTCSSCGETFCMTEMALPMAKSPYKGFRIAHQQVRLEGLCPECK
jgi:Fur family ferric uptake transcriptional regulator